MVTNTKKSVPSTGNLTISKTVTGSGGDTSKYFTFTVIISDNGTYNYTGSKTGTIKSGDNITLCHGQSITVSGLPHNIYYAVVEADASMDGYTVTVTGASGMITKDTTAIASFVNNKTKDSKTPADPDETKEPNIPRTGDGFNPLFWLMLAALSGTGFLGLSCLCKLRRQ